MVKSKRDWWNWKPHTQSEKVLLLITVVFFIITIGLIIGLIAKSKSEQKTCNSKICIEAANELLSNMDSNTEPCTDFYQYACGSFATKSSITEELPVDNNFFRGMINILELLYKVISQPWTTDEFPYYKKVKDLHSSCLNQTKLDERGSEPLLKFLDQLNGWPVIRGSAWKENDFDWRQTLIQFRSMGLDMSHFFTIFVEPDSRDTSKNILTIDTQSLSIPTAYIKDEEKREKYINLMIDLAVMLGAERTRAEREMKSVVEFEKTIIEAPGNTDGSETKYMSVVDLNELLPQISWVDFLNSLNFSARISKYMEVKVTSPTYMESISPILASTGKRIIANYMLWKTVMEGSKLLDDKFREPIKKFYHYPGNFDFEQNKKVFCTFVLSELMNMAIGKIYIDHVFNAESKSEATNMANNIKDAFAHKVEKIKWMDSAAINTAKEKLRLMKLIIGYPEETPNDAQINDYYASARISDDTFFENFFQLRKLDKDYQLTELTEKNEDLKVYHFEMNILMTPYYLPWLNRLEIYASTLEPPFFDPQRPKYLNYGSGGSLFGDNLISGFDHYGKEFDEHGKENNWWSNSTEEKFKEKSESIIQQYIKFTGLDGTLKEKINLERTFVTVHGMDLAYKSYKKWENKNKEELGLPGLPLNSRQLFWLAAANTYCVKNMQNDEPNYAIKYKVITPIINSKAFSKDFNCPVGSPMNPAEKFSFW